MASSQQVSGPFFFEKVGYHLIKDFSPICLIAATPYVLSVNPSVAANSLKEFIALARAKPGTLFYGSSGVGGAPYLAAEMLKTMTDINLVHVPYKSVVYALIDVMGGQVQLAFSVMPAALPMIKQGKLKALGVTSLKRTPLAPDLETIAETVPGYEIIGWYGLVAPIKTPDRIVALLNAEIVKALKSAEIQEKLSAMGADPIGTTPQEFASFLSAQLVSMRKTIEASGVRRD
jgi:tripartite-type tricarboxylate transporter receptor subunit TctC